MRVPTRTTIAIRIGEGNNPTFAATVVSRQHTDGHLDLLYIKDYESISLGGDTSKLESWIADRDKDTDIAVDVSNSPTFPQKFRGHNEGQGHVSFYDTRTGKADEDTTSTVRTIGRLLMLNETNDLLPPEDAVPPINPRYLSFGPPPGSPGTMKATQEDWQALVKACKSVTDSWPRDDTENDLMITSATVEDDLALTLVLGVHVAGLRKAPPSKYDDWSVPINA